ncbi:transient receptor potential cation channel subfamily V member 1 [Solea solea]|uniref:transient receptor potential cation channel subfamily V member 1 n=1 Tax=Solea solea TaxID=90069 RepID=UPI00272CE683|nr:transient receptor potential cation channel subfamily V member 1 [Solea solea]XP_058483453.1 transient receptor potential cation channel subfamily V member 1 [Solea solea]
MKKSEKFGISMETDDRTEEDKTCVGPESPGATMDTNHERRKEGKPELRYNANFYKMMHNLDTDSVAINYSRLFEDVASGDVKRLEGLYQYLQDTGKKLSDSLYQSEGKTALMKALLHLRNNKNDTVELLLDISEKQGDIDKFVNAAYNSKYYNGQTALHIAIERRSLPYVKLLVSKGANVHAKADGKFFQPHDGPNFYFGELPLSLAACTNQADIVDFLMENAQADAKLTDSHGNTVLHALVVVAAVKCEDNTEFVTSMYDRVLKTSDRLHPKLKLEDIKNKMGLTPLKLAAKTGKIGIFSHILKREFHDSHTKHLSRKFTEWVYGPVHSSLYDLASVDSCEDGSVMEILIYGSDIPNRHEMLETEPVSQMLEHKWKKFAGGMFVLNFLFYVAYLIIFTLVSYNKRNGNPPFETEHTIKGYLYVSGQLMTLLANVYFFFIGIIDMRRKRPKLKTLLIDGYYEILFFVQGVLFLVTAALYVLGRHEYLGFMVMCLALSWVNVLYFSRGDRHMGIYSVMIQKMILSDILRFLFVYVVFLFGFSAAVVTLLIEPPAKNITRNGRFFSPVAPDEPCVKPTFRNISYTTLQLFKFTIGMGDMEFTEDYQYREVFYILLIGYIILTYILLLNMLIALMNRTVERITKDSASIWKLQRAITILDMEKRLPACLRRSFHCGVQKELGPAVGDDCRQCLRVEEVNWNKWNINLSKINEDPGCWDRPPQTAIDAPLNSAWRSRRGLFSGRRQRQQSTEMTPLSSMPV